MSEVDALYIVSVVLLAGIISGHIAEQFKFPSTIPLILTGMIIALIGGSTFNLEGAHESVLLIAEIALVTILFKEGMHLNLKMLKTNILVISLLAIVGTILTSLLVGVVTFFTIALFTLPVAFLIGAILSPTDPAATFSILKEGDKRIKGKIEIILGGESAFNDVIAIILVIVIFIPSIQNPTGLSGSADIILESLWQFFGGIIFGILIGLLALLLIKRIPKDMDNSMVTLAIVFLIFTISLPIKTSAPIAALFAGIIVSNPSILKFNYSKSKINTFWDTITYFLEIIAFVFIGTLILLTHIEFRLIPLALFLSLIAFGARFFIIFFITLPLKLPKIKSNLSTNEKVFVAFAGMKGLTTAILASLAYVSLVEIEAYSEIAEVILYSSIFVLILTGTIQGLFLKQIATQLNIYEDLSEIERIQTKSMITKSSMDYLITKYEKKEISTHAFQKLILPIREEFIYLEEKLSIFVKDRDRELEIFNTQLGKKKNNLEMLKNAYEKGIIKEHAYEWATKELIDEQAQLLLQKRQLMKDMGNTSMVHDSSEINLIDLELTEQVMDYLLESNKLNPLIEKEFKKAKKIIQEVKEKNFDLE